MRSRPLLFTATVSGLLALLSITLILSIILGARDVSLINVYRALLTNIVNDQTLVIREIRLPRELAALFVGAALAVAGAIMQGMTRNPLADPGLLGLTAGANLGLALVMAFAGQLSFMITIIACFVGAAVGAGLVFGIGSMKKGGLSPVRLVLAGSAVSAFLYAISEGVAINFKVVKNVSMWTSGGFVGSSWNQLSLLIPIVVVGITLAILFSKQVTILSLSEDVASGLGLNTLLSKAILFVLVTMLAGVSVALAGNFVFVGLMIPHVARRLVGTDYTRIIPVSAILGAIFMLGADTIARVINAPFETSVVAIVAILGIPFFLFIVNRGGRTV
ncbi:FecCD family ABC transporter permease [Paenibacillus tarimensis]|uniref:FecCD family ABC transporter permease n=1 Tax=Paenibacillus tarimensis TaxID=416012 RepID=UPI001F3A2717|nr:iron ABC transporter permease [Paenibacillus tarimensis]MCF2944463.1 iron ABC transporter permease [Paenibacillus tarimensis]